MKERPVEWLHPMQLVDWMGGKAAVPVAAGGRIGTLVDR